MAYLSDQTNNIRYWNTYYSKDNDLTFVSSETEYNLDNVIKSISKESYEVVGHDMPYDPINFLTKVYEFESKRKYRYQGERKEKFKQRFGFHFILLLPVGYEEKYQGKGLDYRESLVKNVKCFVRNIRGSEIGLKYVYWIVPIVKIARYVHIYMTDREYFYQYTFRYKRNEYANKVTGRKCCQDDPDKIITRKKGAIKRIEKDTFSENKSRLLAANTKKELSERKNFKK